MTRMRESWGAGPWDDEPDQAAWTDEATGLECFAGRNYAGAWCAYVRLPDGHPWQTHPHDYPDAEVHGSVTWTGPLLQDSGAPMYPDGPTDGWWVGFDCYHSFDEAPGRMADWREALRALGSLAEALAGIGRDVDGTAYRGLAYVRAEAARLAAQVAAAGGAA